MLLFRNQGDGSDCEVSADGVIDMNLIPGTYMVKERIDPPPQKKYIKHTPSPKINI